MNNRSQFHSNLRPPIPAGMVIDHNGSLRNPSRIVGKGLSGRQRRKTRKAVGKAA